MQNIILNLTSGLLGAIVGGIVSWLVSKDAIEKSAKKSYENSLKLDELKEKRQIKSVKIAFTTESKENLAAIQELGAQKYRLSNKAWDAYKHFIPAFSEDQQLKLIKAYNSITAHNTTIDYDFHVSAGSGFYDAQLQRQRQIVSTNLNELISVLS